MRKKERTNNMQTRKEDPHVRLSEEAHALLAEKAKYLGDSMKEVASEAVISRFKRELKHNEYIALINGLEGEIRDNRYFAVGTFLLGAVIGGVLAVIMGVVL